MKVIWDEWKINYSSVGSNNYEKALPLIECMNTAMDYLKELNKEENHVK